MKLPGNQTQDSTPPLRIAFGRFMQESNSFSPIRTQASDFTHYSEGQALYDSCRPGQWEIKGFLRNLELSGFMKALRLHVKQGVRIEALPLYSAWAISGGALSAEAFEHFCSLWEEKLRAAGPVDAVFVALHGALDVDGVPEPEGQFLARTRAIVGDRARIAITLDMHGVLTPDKLRHADLMIGYRTNPHRDFVRTGFKAGDLLVRTLLGKIAPRFAWRSLPMITGGGAGVDFLPPAWGLFRRMKALERKYAGKLLHCNIFICHPFISHPDLGWGVYALTDNDPELAERVADELAERCWAVRFKRYEGFHTVESAIQKARRAFLSRKLGTITISDASDIVAAGGTGENTQILQALMQQAKGMLCYVPLRDAEVVYAFWEQPEGTRIEAVVGGKIQPEYNPPLPITGTILLKKETKDFGKVLVVDMDHIKLVLTEGAALALKPSFYTDLGLNAWKPDITVVKSLFHFRIYYFFISRRTFYVRTRGITDLDITHHIATNDPVFPRDAVEDWRDADARRRGLQSHERRVYFKLK